MMKRLVQGQKLSRSDNQLSKASMGEKSKQTTDDNFLKVTTHTNTKAFISKQLSRRSLNLSIYSTNRESEEKNAL